MDVVSQIILLRKTRRIVEMNNLHGFRMELLCRGHSPSSPLQYNEDLLDPSYWIRAGAMSTCTVPVGPFLERIDEALAMFRSLRIAVGNEVPFRLFCPSLG